MPDPAAVTDSDAEKLAVFRDVFRTLENRIKIFASLPVGKLDRLMLTRKLREIGHTESVVSAGEGT